MKQTISLLSPLILLAGCATLAPPEVRKVSYVEETKANKGETYQRALKLLAKKFGDSNSTIKVQDKEAGQIVAKGVVQCLVLRQAGDFLNDYNLGFTLDFEAKENKYRLLFEDLVILDATGKAFGYSYNQMTSAEQVEKVKPCLAPIRTELAAAINGGSGW
jgi:hypothetical protein